MGQGNKATATGEHCAQHLQGHTAAACDGSYLRRQVEENLLEDVCEEVDAAGQVAWPTHLAVPPGAAAHLQHTEGKQCTVVAIS